MKENPLYQTVDGAKGLPKKPIFCNSDDAWLGDGYYFWDDSLESAKWWGDIHYKRNYIICESSYDSHSDDYLDLIGNQEDRRYFKRCADAVCRKKYDKYTVGEILEIIKQKDPNFDALAIRAYPLSIKHSCCNVVYFSDNRFCIEFNEKFQMCVIDLNFLIKDYTPIEYPDILNEDFAI